MERYPPSTTLLVPAILLASANGTIDAERNPQDGDQPFIFTSPSTTGIVTLNVGTAADIIAVKFQMVPEDPGCPEHLPSWLTTRNRASQTKSRHGYEIHT